MWQVDGMGQRVFAGGREDGRSAAATAGGCTRFRPDDEDEQVADEHLSCYNCRYRRWTTASFVCLA